MKFFEPLSELFYNQQISSNNSTDPLLPPDKFFTHTFVKFRKNLPAISFDFKDFPSYFRKYRNDEKDLLKLNFFNIFFENKQCVINAFDSLRISNDLLIEDKRRTENV